MRLKASGRDRKFGKKVCKPKNKTLDPPQKFQGISGEVCVTCTECIAVTECFNTRHRTSLML